MAGAREATLVTGGFFYVLYSAGWSPGESTDPGSPLHGANLAATTMTFAGITARQVGTAFAARTSRASLSEIGIFSNRRLLWGILFELAFAAAVIYLPPLQAVFGTNALDVRELAILALFPPLVWGTDELRRWARRSRKASESSQQAPRDQETLDRDHMTAPRIAILGAFPAKELPHQTPLAEAANARPYTRDSTARLGLDECLCFR